MDPTLAVFLGGLCIAALAAVLTEKATTRGARRNHAAKATENMFAHIKEKQDIPAEQAISLQAELYEYYFNSIVAIERGKQLPQAPNPPSTVDEDS